MSKQLPPGTIPYLRGRFEQGDVVLFTGAGFSMGARNQVGGGIPSVDELRGLLSGIVYPESPLDSKDSLQDLFGLARTRAYNQLRDLLTSQFSVDRTNIPEYYIDIFGAAWFRVYTLNIDDLPDAVHRSATLPRSIISLSPARLSEQPRSEGLQVIHLNGRWDDGPEGVTFSPFEIADRYPGRDPLHAQCAVDILSRPVVFIGTRLDEPPLWQHIQLRKTAKGKDLRRRSFLVAPSISRSRKDLLERELHVEHIAMDGEEFFDTVLKAAVKGSSKFFLARAQKTLWDEQLDRPPLVSQLSVEPAAADIKGEYLLGREPTWQDILKGRASTRDYEVNLRAIVDSSLAQEAGEKPPVILAGTAGSGKTTACMRLALSLSAQGTTCGWTSADQNVSPADLRSLAALGELPEVLFIDDADRFGNDASLIARDLRAASNHPLVIIAVRSGRVERIADRLKLLKVDHVETVVPRLTDNDISSLIAVLDRENRLGVLKNKPLNQQITLFRDRERANRDLLVAMLEATSGRRFEEKLEEELDQLEGQQRFVYAMVAIATAYRFGLTQDQVLLGVGDASNESLQALRDLTRRLLILEHPGGTLRVRHRVVGERLVRYLTRSGSLRDPLQSLTIALATELGPLRKRSSATYRTVKVLMNHDWLRKSLGRERARGFLAELEPYLSWDHHYWLQRGSLELESGEESTAENFLNQAAGIEPSDLLVRTELGYLRLRQAAKENDRNHARELLDLGLTSLESVIKSRNHFDPHQYDIFGRGLLKWSRRPDLSPAEKAESLRDAADMVEEGRRKHPNDSRLRELYVSIQNARLGHSETLPAE